MRVLITVLYVVSFLMLAEGFRRLLLLNHEVRRALAWAAKAESGAAPPDEVDWQFGANRFSWGAASARWVGKALELSQGGQTTGAVIAVAGGTAALAGDPAESVGSVNVAVSPRSPLVTDVGRRRGWTEELRGGDSPDQPPMAETGPAAR